MLESPLNSPKNVINCFYSRENCQHSKNFFGSQIRAVFFITKLVKPVNLIGTCSKKGEFKFSENIALNHSIKFINL